MSATHSRDVNSLRKKLEEYIVHIDCSVQVSRRLSVRLCTKFVRDRISLLPRFIADEAR